VRHPLRTSCDVDAGAAANDAGCEPLSCLAHCGDHIPAPGQPYNFVLTNCEHPEVDAGDASVICNYLSPPCGRRPEGIALEPTSRGTAGEWLAASAFLEEASIAAFARLACELKAHGAPHDLRRRAREAAKDEVRHARTMRSLALDAGCAPARPPRSHTEVRDLVRIAVENAVEGCIRETFGALLATWQAAVVVDGELKKAMTEIARDEAAHAALAWDVHAWLGGRLTAEERADVDGAAREAIVALETELSVEPPAALVRDVGLPDAARAHLLMRMLFHGTERALD
jgi:rubrerythrin